MSHAAALDHNAPNIVPLPLHRTPRPWPPAPSAHELRVDERAAIHGGVWFSRLSDGLQRTIVARAQLRRLDAGTVVAQRGDVAPAWFGVARGAVRLSTALADGRSFTLDFVGPGQWFGDIAVVDDKPLELDVVTHLATTLLVLPKADLKRLIDAEPELRDALLQLNCQRLRYLCRRFEELHTLPLAQRLARQVLRLAHLFGRRHSQGLCIDLGMSQADLASLVGASRQRVNRAWRQMHALGLVDRQPQRLLVRDAQALEAVAAGQLQLADAGRGAD